MIRTKKMIGVGTLALAALVGISQWVHALQTPQGPGPGGPGFPRLQQLAKQLDLTDAQKTQIKSILDNARTQLQALRSNMNITKQQELDQRRQIEEQTQNSIRAVLTPEQQAKADQLRQQAQDRMAAQQEKMQQQMLTRLTKQLNLSSAQQSLIQSYLNDQKSQLQTLKNNTSLTPAQKLEQMRTIRQQTQEKIKSALTADQQAQLDQLRQQAQNRMRKRFGRRGGFGPMRGPQGGFQNQGFSL
ncbi:MAG: Spy/CpxP family protein refolding chaperone [Acidobacteria bacterium]|nr:Spy/CpxP family protein refolding chaperone [Acidobacteriota bacterium]